MKERFVHSRVVAVVGGKGGVGKTTVTAELGLLAGARGCRTLVIDGDLGLANLDVVLGVQARWTLPDVLDGRCELRDVILPVGPGLSIIPGASGLYDFANLPPVEQQALMDKILELDGHFDLVLVDTASALLRSFGLFASIAHEVVVISTPQAASLKDAYATIKVLSTHCGFHTLGIVANKVTEAQDGKRLFAQLNGLADRFLNTELRYLGSVQTSSDASQLCPQAHGDMGRVARRLGLLPYAGPSARRDSASIWEGIPA